MNSPRINLVYQKQRNELQINQYMDCLSDQNCCNADWLYFKTFMNFSAGVYDVIAPAKQILTNASDDIYFSGAYNIIIFIYLTHRSIFIFLVHITSLYLVF